MKGLRGLMAGCGELHEGSLSCWYGQWAKQEARRTSGLWRTVEGMVEGSEEFIKRHRGRGEDGGLDLVGG